MGTIRMNIGMQLWLDKRSANRWIRHNASRNATSGQSREKTFRKTVNTKQNI